MTTPPPAPVGLSSSGELAGAARQYRQYRQLIDGAWVQAEGGKAFDEVYPYRGRARFERWAIDQFTDLKLVTGSQNTREVTL